jgi:phosphoribosylformylglycinamidine synthase
MIKQDLILAGHDVSAGGMITALLEMCFPIPDVGLRLDLSALKSDTISVLFSENPGVLLQIEKETNLTKINNGLAYFVLGEITGRTVEIKSGNSNLTFDIDSLRNTWFKT